jgi:hypothetical protein
MEVFMNAEVKSIFAGAVLGAIVFYIAAYFILGHTAAIVLPGSIADWAKENSANFPVLFVWELLVVQLLGIGILSAIAAYLLLRITSLKWLYVAIGFVAADLILSPAYLLSLPTLEYLSVTHFIWFAPHFIVVFLCVFIAASLGGKHQSV